jgi:hypothetical protein
MKNAALATLDTVLDDAVRAVETWLAKGPAAAMNEFNQRASSS